jgi:Glu-tRNA(Gln) amidotransferase subunit E-like FAD-binding protein
LPKTKSEIKAELKKKGLADELINLVLGEDFDEFLTLMKVYDKDANLVAKMVTLWRSELAAKSKKDVAEIAEVVNERILEEILENLNKGKIGRSDIKGIMEKVAGGEELESVLKAEKINDDSLEEEISKIIKEKLGLRPNAYMGLVMQKFKGKIDAKKAMEIIEKIVGK